MCDGWGRCCGEEVVAWPSGRVALCLWSLSAGEDRRAMVGHCTAGCGAVDAVLLRGGCDRWKGDIGSPEWWRFEMTGSVVCVRKRLQLYRDRRLG